MIGASGKLFILFTVTVNLLGLGVPAEGKDKYSFERARMVERQLKARGIKDEKVLEAMNRVERHLFVPVGLREMAYEDTPLPIGYGQTISQPYIVAYMTEAVRVGPGDKVLEIGTGSGYQAAILAELGSEVYSIERVGPLAEASGALLKKLGYGNVHVKWGDGYKGWPEEAPFDIIIVTAAPPGIPGGLVEQLKTSGRMVVPVGSFFQELYLVTRTDKGVEKERLIPVRFVPMVEGKD